MVRIYFLITVCFVLMGVSPIFAQQPTVQFEYGSPNELKSVSKIYVYTGSDLKARKNIIKIIQKKLTNIIITDRPEDAEVHLIFAADAYTFYAGTWTNGSTTSNGNLNDQGTYSGQSNTTSSSTPIYQNVVTGAGIVGKIKDKDTIRLLLDFADTRNTLIERSPSTNFARAFIKAYVEANKNPENK